MATVAISSNFRWSVETNLALGFATKEDLMLGDMMISKNVDLDGILDESWIEIEVKLGSTFQTPIDRSMDLPHHTTQYLSRIHAYLATAIVVMGQGGSNPDALRYSDYLRTRAYELIENVVGGANLGGLVYTTNDPEQRSYAPSVFIPEEGSPFDFWEQQVHRSDHPRELWRPSTTYTDPNA